MADSFSFAPKVVHFGFHPPPENGGRRTMQENIGVDQRQETHSFYMGCDGNVFKRTDLKQERRGESDSEEGPLQGGNGKGTFWTVCPYCYHMYEYEKMYEECCLLYQNCKRGFHGLAVAQPPERFLVKGDGAEYYSGYGFFPLGCLGDSFLGGKKEVGKGDTGKKPEVVEISDDSDDEKKETDVKNESGKAKVEVSGNGEGRGIRMRVKTVPRNSKKIMGMRRKVEEMSVESGNGVGDGDGDGVNDGRGSGDSCDMDVFEFINGDIMI